MTHPAGDRTRLTSRLLLGSAAVACTGTLLIAALLAGPARNSEAGTDAEGRVVLPASVAGFASREDPASAALLAGLVDRLSEDPAVATVAAGAYRGEDDDLVVLLLTPRRPLDDETAGRLTAEVLGAAGNRRGMSSDFRSGTSDDDRALVTCSTPEPGTSTCVAVEATQALLVMLSGSPLDPVATTEQVRDDLARR